MHVIKPKSTQSLIIASAVSQSPMRISLSKSAEMASHHDFQRRDFMEVEVPCANALHKRHPHTRQKTRENDPPGGTPSLSLSVFIIA